MSPTERELRDDDLGWPEPDAAALDRLAATGHARNGFCEACWAMALGRAQTQPEKSQADHYADIVAEANRYAERSTSHVH